MKNRFGQLLALVLLVLFAVTGCGLGLGPPADSSATESAPSDPAAPTDATTPSATEPPPATGSSGSGPPAGTNADDLGSVVATKTTADSGATVTMRLYSVVRDGNLAHVRLTLGADERYQVSGLLSDRNPEAGDADNDAADGIAMVDPGRSKMYLAASDGQGRCLCSRALFATLVETDAPRLITATFAAPPPEVTSIEVHMPAFGVFAGVPVG